MSEGIKPASAKEVEQAVQWALSAGKTLEVLAGGSEDLVDGAPVGLRGVGTRNRRDRREKRQYGNESDSSHRGPPLNGFFPGGAPPAPAARANEL